MEKESLKREVGGSHYKHFAVEPIEFIVSNNLDFVSGCLFKYLLRYKFKNGLEDLSKCLHYCDIALDLGITKSKPKETRESLKYYLEECNITKDNQPDVVDALYCVIDSDWSACKVHIESIITNEYI